MNEGEGRGRAISISLLSTQGSSLERPPAQRLGVLLALFLTPRQRHRLRHHEEKEPAWESTSSFQVQLLTIRHYADLDVRCWTLC